MTSEAIIISGGSEGRFKSVKEEIPIAMAPINDKPFLEYQLSYLEHWGIKHLILTVGYKADLVKDYFKDQYKSMSIEYVVEDDSIGTGGALKKAMQRANEMAVFVLDGRMLFDVSLRRLFNFKRSKQADVAMSLRFVPEVTSHGSVKIDTDAKVVDFCGTADQYGEEYINGGVICIGTQYFLSKNLADDASFQKDFLEKYYQSDSMYGFKCYSYYKDISDPKDYMKAQNEFKSLPY